MVQILKCDLATNLWAVVLYDVHEKLVVLGTGLKYRDALQLKKKYNKAI